MQRALRGLLGAVAVVALNGCAVAATMRAYDVMPNGLERGDQALRDLLTQADGNARRIGNHGPLPKDVLLRALYEGTLAYYAGDYDAAVKRFETAWQLSEDRYTKSLSRGALSLVLNDRALEYLPGENERLFIHYYAALAYLKKNEPQEAAVEARRLVYQLQRLEEKSTPRDRQTRAMLRYFAATVFEAAGESNDALVAYRNAALALGDTAGARRQTLSPGGQVVVVVEQGFVAHRVNQSIWVELGRNESHLFATRDDDGYRRGAWGVAGRVASSLDARVDEGLFVAGDAEPPRFDAPMESLPDSATARAPDSLGSVGTGPDSVLHEVPSRSVPATVVSMPAPGEAARAAPPRAVPAKKGPDEWVKEHILRGNSAAGVLSEASSADTRASRRRRDHVTPHAGDRQLRVSLPAFHRLRGTALPSVTLGDSALGARVSASLSDAAIADYARQRNAVLARAVARAAARYAINSAVERKASEKWGETTGDIVGFFAQAAGAALERADTRSWNLLPERVTIVRVPARAADEARLVVRAGGARPVFIAPRRDAALISVQPARFWAQY